MVEIVKSVGKGGVNKPVDVIKMQALVNNNDLYTGLVHPSPVTGKVDDILIAAIKNFQSTHPELLSKKPDGRIDPGGKTLDKLNQYNNSARQCIDYFPRGFTGTYFVRFDIDKFVELYALQYPPLGSSSRNALSGLVDRLINDSDIIDVRWAAYMLATVKHECANTWKPIEEYGKGAAYDYGKAVQVKDPDKNIELTNIYYGRGYVQLTWEKNYKEMDNALGLKAQSSLHLYPSNALEPDTAYKIMSYGMRHGSFTKKKLSDYISGGAADYYNARRIINGLDKADLIKGYAENIEFLIRFCNGV